MADDHLPQILRRSTLVVREVRCACTREHLALASHNHLCQTYFRKKATHEKRPEGGEGNTMDLGTGIALLVAFLAVVVLIIRGQSPIIMLLILAVLWAAIAGIGIEDIQKKIIQAGGVQYASAVIIIVFGAWFAQVLIQTGIAESVIRSAVELAGDRPMVTAMTITLVTALLFTSMYGVGAAIAIGVIALPIMMSQGVPPYVAAPVFTMGIGAGTFINLVQFGTFQKLFPGIKYEAPYLTYWVIGMCVYILAAWMLAFFYLRNGAAHRLASVDVAGESAPPARKRTPYYTYIVPIFPVIMILVLKWEIIPTFLVSILLALALTWPDRTLQGHLNLFNKTFSDAFPDIATIAALWTICGMIIVAGQTPEVAGALKPIFAPVLPHTPLQAAVFFGLLGGIASIYRGPIVVIGTGAALLAIILANKEIPIPYLYSIWLAPTVLQGSMDPTNSWTLWTIGHTKVSHGQFLRTALPFGCLMVAVNSLICYLMLGSLQ
jgi:Gnt-I system high-affinity gluconate transporter